MLYAVYILMLRQATADRARSGTERPPVVAPLLQATIGATFGSAVLGLVLRDFRLGPAWPALGWLVLLALTSQVLGWLLITMSMPGLPAWLVGVLLLVQPAGSLTLSAVFLDERPSGPQLVGVAVMLAGVLIAASRAKPPCPACRPMREKSAVRRAPPVTRIRRTLSLTPWRDGVHSSGRLSGRSAPATCSAAGRR